MYEVRSIFRSISSGALALVLAGGLAALRAEGLPADLVQGWDEYVRLTEQRVAAELRSAEGFLAHSFDDPERVASQRDKALSGAVVVQEIKTTRPDGANVKTPAGMVHHWRGTIFIPGVTLDTVLDAVRHPDVDEYQQEDVLESQVLDRTADSVLLYLKLKRSQIVTVTYNTEHFVRYRRHGPYRASSRSTATKLAELADAGSQSEREKPFGKDRGFLWGLNSYWRYEQVDGGVLVECESLTLSRSIPSLVAPLVRPMVHRVAKQSMVRTLESMRNRLPGLVGS